MEPISSFGAWLRRRRRALDLTQDELARQAGCALGTLKKLETDERRPSKQLAERLADCLAIPATERVAFLKAARAELAVDRLPVAVPPEQVVAYRRPTPLPSGTVTFLFTDIEGSTRLWEQYPQAMPDALARHDAILRTTTVAHGGVVYKVIGDAFQAAFTTAPAACAAALAAQSALASEAWGVVGTVPVRMALHTCAAEPTDGDYRTGALNRLGRLLDAVHGGQIVLSQSTADLARETLSPDGALRNMGEHHLRDLRPEPVFQLVAPDLPSDFPPLKTLDLPRHNLPPQPTALIGRAHEVAAVRKRLLRDDVRLLTLTGPGGTGKTRLGLQTAAELLDDFKDGVWFVNLAPISDPALVATTIAQALGLRGTGARPLLDSLKDYLREKQLLLLLDNFEQVAAAGPLVVELLAAAAQLKVIVTSREVLHLSGEYECEVPPLSLPDIHHLPAIEQLTQYEAVRLFIERAQAVRADFAVTAENAPAIAESCVRLDGLPLAIELAAARSKLFPPKALLTRLDKRLALLTGGPHDMPARQQTLRNTIAWSYALLDPAEQAIFVRLGVFVGGCLLEAAEAVLADDRTGGDELTAYISASAVLDGVMSLVDKSLLTEVEDVRDEPRFMLLETIREFALEQLQTRGEDSEIQRRHTQFFMEFAESAEPHLYGAGQHAWVQRLEADHNNLRAALEWAIQNASVIGLRVAGALGWFWHFHRHHREGYEWLLKALASAKDNEGVQLDRFRAKALDRAGYLAIWLHDFTHATSLLEQSVTLCRELGDQCGLAQALCDWGAAVQRRGDLNLARVLLDESVVIFRQVGDKPGLVRALFWYGRTTSLQDDFETARASAEESIVLGREIGDVSNIAASSAVLAYSALRQGDYTVAQSLYEEGLRLFREAEDSPGIALLLAFLGSLAYRQGHYDQARLLFGECVQLWRELGSRYDTAWGLSTLGYVALRQHNGQHAAALFAESLALCRELSETHGMARCLAGLAEVAQSAGQLERGARLHGATEVLLAASGTNMEDTPAQLNSGYVAITSQAEFERQVVAARAQLDEATFATAWAEGRALTLEQAIAYALEPTLEEPPTAQSQSARPQPRLDNHPI